MLSASRTRRSTRRQRPRRAASGGELASYIPLSRNGIFTRHTFRYLPPIRKNPPIHTPIFFPNCGLLTTLLIGSQHQRYLASNQQIFQIVGPESSCSNRKDRLAIICAVFWRLSLPEGLQCVPRGELYPRDGYHYPGNTSSQETHRRRYTPAHIAQRTQTTFRKVTKNRNCGNVQEEFLFMLDDPTNNSYLNTVHFHQLFQCACVELEVLVAHHHILVGIGADFLQLLYDRRCDRSHTRFEFLVPGGDRLRGRAHHHILVGGACGRPPSHPSRRRLSSRPLPFELLVPGGDILRGAPRPEERRPIYSTYPPRVIYLKVF